MNILLVEPDDFMRSLFQSVLERDGFHVIAVKDQRDGLAASRAMPVDLVVAQFFDEADTTKSAELLTALGTRSPQFKLVAVISGFRTRATTATALQRMLTPWRTVDLAWGGHVVLDACRDAARERRLNAPTPALHERAL